MRDNLLYQSFSLNFILNFPYFLFFEKFRMQIDFIEIVFQKDNFNLLILDLPNQIKGQYINISFLINDKFQKLLIDRLVKKGIITKINLAQKRQFLQKQQILATFNLIVGDIELLNPIKLFQFLYFSQSIIP